MESLSKLLESVRLELPGHQSIIQDEKISPFIPKEIGDIEPGKVSIDLSKFTELFPGIFTEQTGFMGGQGGYSEMMLTKWGWADELIFRQDGHFAGDGSFHAPIAVYRANPKKTPYKLPYYILFQLGNYQMLGGEVFLKESESLLPEGKIKVYRGIRGNPHYNHPKLNEASMGDYFKYIACSFLSPSLALAFNGIAIRSETNHVAIKRFNDFFHRANIPSRFPEMEQSHSTIKDIARGKFGPRYISMKTPLDNLRIFSEWAGEGEVRLLDPQRVENIMLHERV